jgi:membrane-associated phospholipid phosphatase
MLNDPNTTATPPMSKFFATAAVTAAPQLPGDGIGLRLLLLAGVGLFGAVAADVMRGGALSVLDLELSHWFHAHAGGWWTQAMLGLAHWHSVAGIAALSTLLGLHFYRRKAWCWLLTLGAAVPGGMLLNVLLKTLFGRARPRFDNPILSLPTYSFPSGHTVSSTLFYGLLAAYLMSRTDQTGLRIACVAGAALMAALVGVSRLSLGVHYLSDVLAAMAEGCAWLALCLLAASRLQRRAGARSPC